MLLQQKHGLQILTGFLKSSNKFVIYIQFKYIYNIHHELQHKHKIKEIFF